MELKLQLSVVVLLIQVSLAALQRMTVEKGQTVNLRCPLRNGLKTNVEWKNPEGCIMFFNRSKGIKDKRYSMKKLSESEFIISISNVTFKDGGNYTCSQYGIRTTEKKVEVTVLGRPKMSVANHEGQFVIKCTAEGNHHPPQISWKLDHGPEIISHVQVLHENKKYVSMGILHVRSVENKVTVKCLVRHPALHSQHLINFVKIGRDLPKFRHTTTTTTSSPTPQPHGSTMYFATKDVNGPSSESSMISSSEPKMATAPTGFPLNPVTSTGSQLSTSGSTRKRNDTISNANSTTGWTSVSETTEGITLYNHTEGNTTGSINDPKMHTGTEGSSSLLVLLVTCLIFCLLVVVIFFAIKLRRAHITWKRENEESDPSEESSKSKSSQEEKNSQGQRRRGLINTAFTQYVVEEPTLITSVINTAAVATKVEGNNKQTSQPQILGQTSAKCAIKETEL